MCWANCSFICCWFQFDSMWWCLKDLSSLGSHLQGHNWVDPSSLCPCETLTSFNRSYSQPMSVSRGHFLQHIVRHPGTFCRAMKLLHRIFTWWLAFILGLKVRWSVREVFPVCLINSRESAVHPCSVIFQHLYGLCVSQELLEKLL